MASPPELLFSRRFWSVMSDIAIIGHYPHGVVGWQWKSSSTIPPKAMQRPASTTKRGALPAGLLVALAGKGGASQGAKPQAAGCALGVSIGRAAGA
jgi:hypothetical protein